jgi:hypothetical protein
MKRELECLNNDLILLSQQIAEFQVNSEKDESFIIPVKISYAIHNNEQTVMKNMTKYENKRGELLRRHVKFDKDGNAMTVEVEVNGKMQKNYVFKDEKAYMEAYTKLLQEKVKLELYVYKEDENDLKGMSGNQKILNQMWYLLDVFANYNNKEAVSEFRNEIENTVNKSNEDQ